MDMKERLHLFEDDSHILETIAKRYGGSSKEYRALKHAAIALWYVLAEDHAKFQRICH